MSKFNSKDITAEFYADFPESAAHLTVAVIDGDVKKRANAENLQTTRGEFILQFLRNAVGYDKAPSANAVHNHLGEGELVPQHVRLGWSQTSVVIGPDVHAGLPDFFERAGRINAKLFPPSDPTRDIFQQWVYDHELGHAVEGIPLSGKISESYSENVADSYSILRHRQRYGFDTSFPQDLATIRSIAAFHVIDVTHDTADAVKLADRYAKRNKNELQNMSPEKLLKKAQQIARHTSFTPEQVEIYARGMPPLLDLQTPSIIDSKIRALPSDKSDFLEGRRNRYTEALYSVGDMASIPSKNPSDILASILKTPSPNDVSAQFASRARSVDHLLDLVRDAKRDAVTDDELTYKPSYAAEMEPKAQVPEKQNQPQTKPAATREAPTAHPPQQAPPPPEPTSHTAAPAVKTSHAPVESAHVPTSSIKGAITGGATQILTAYAPISNIVSNYRHGQYDEAKKRGRNFRRGSSRWHCRWGYRFPAACWSSFRSCHR